MKKPLTVTIGIPAHNEEANILHVLRSILMQKGESFIIEKIIVLCDSCTDKTAEIASTFAKKYTHITVISETERKGKVARLNQLYALNISDVFINFDADIILCGSTMLEKMVKIFIEEKDTVMVAAHQVPIPTKTFIGNIIYAGYQFWDMARLSVKNYDHIQNHYGAATALRKSFIQHVQFPKDITDDRGYLYILAKKIGNFRYTMNAKIYYRPVSTMRDFLTLYDRSFSKNQDALAKYFSANVYRLYHIPLYYKLRAIGIMFVKSPFYTTLAVLLNIYTRLFPKHDVLYNNGMWEISLSTKKAISYISSIKIYP